MNTRIPLPLLLLLLLLAPAALALTPDGLSLLAFKSAVSSDPTSSLSSWSDSDPDPCRWPGISCANVSGFSSPRVVGIAVSSKNLSGYIPSELGSLLFLRRLNLHGNRLSGSIPTQLFNATSLHSLFLYDNSLTGDVPPEICNLPRIQNLDLSRNSLSGPIPPELRNCRQLQRLRLAENEFSGEIPAGIWPEMLSLTQLDLSSNNLSGPLPPDIGDLNSLSGTLNLSHNHFSGRIPSSLSNLPASVNLDLSYNNLSGEIPPSVSDQGVSSFLGNPRLCGSPLQATCQESPSPQSSPPSPDQSISTRDDAVQEQKRGLRPTVIILISVADAAGVALIGLVLVYIYWKLKDRDNSGCSCTGTKKLGGEGGERGKTSCIACFRPNNPDNSSSDDDGGGGGGEKGSEGRLVAIDKGFKFELDELLRASAYVLGKSGVGIVYKVVVGNGMPVAVRRLGEGGGGGGQRWREFAAEVEAIAKVRHSNVVRLRAYYWAQDEKLLITDFISNGNLASALRGRPGQPSLSWPIRLKIAKGAACGLAHLHECSPRKYVHGNIKPSNILLDGDFNPYISDFGLIRLLSVSGADPSSSSSSLGLMGGALPATKAVPIEKPNSYRAPEARVPGARPMQKWDVYSFGVVLLEMLTGKAPDMSSPSVATTSTAWPAEDLVKWVRRGFEDANPLSEMVDPILHKDVHAKKEIISVFHIALACTESDPEVRPRMKTVSDNLDRVGS